MIRRWDKSRPPSGPFALNRDCPQAQGLVAWWPLGGASGKVFVPDLSGKHHLAPGTAPGSVTLGNDGRPALSFVAASSQYLTVGIAPVDAVPLTLTAWGKADSSTQTPIYIGGVANDNFFRIVLVSGKVRANCGTLTGPTQANAITSASYTTGAWQLFGATFASTSSRTVYLNGGNSVNETTSISPTAVNTRVFVGTGITVADAILQPWNGDLGETGVWNVALSADMHARLYNEGTRYELWYPLRSRKWMVSAGGGAYTATLTESASAADAAAAAYIAAVSVSESITAADTLAAATTWACALTETASASDLAAAIIHAVAALTEAASAADSQATGSIYTGSLDESASAADALTAAATLVALLTEVATTSDAASSAATWVRLLTEPATAVDSVAGAQGATYTASVTEVLAATELLVAVLGVAGIASLARYTITAAPRLTTITAAARRLEINR